VQGHLWHKPLTVTVQTQCKHCACPMTLRFDQNLACLQKDEGSEPLVFSPDLDWANFKEPNIIHKY
jgi:hypothetical protein